VTDIEKSYGGAHGFVLIDDTGILDGHFPSTEIDKSGAESAMLRIERGALE
jgi:hypothetical protein